MHGRDEIFRQNFSLKAQGKKPHGTFRHKYENIKMNLNKAMGVDEWIHMG
jgi:hypothetical protein